MSEKNYTEIVRGLSSPSFKIMKTDLILPEVAYVKNWKILQKDILPQGFDFIDFHLKHGGTDKYNNFIKAYKFKG